jgi:hypothetical protein
MAGDSYGVARPVGGRSMKAQRGAALILALGYLMALTLFASVFYTAVHQTAGAERDAEKQQAAFNLAEAGIDWAIVQLRADETYRGESAHTLGEGEFRVIVEPSGEDGRAFLITSTGYVMDGAIPIGEARRRVRVVFGPGRSVQAYLPVGLRP